MHSRLSASSLSTCRLPPSGSGARSETLVWADDHLAASELSRSSQTESGRRRNRLPSCRRTVGQTPLACPAGPYDRAVKALGHVEITDVITLIGDYTSVSMM